LPFWLLLPPFSLQPSLPLLLLAPIGICHSNVNGPLTPLLLLLLLLLLVLLLLLLLLLPRSRCWNI
jgi:hypothetical protein